MHKKLEDWVSSLIFSPLCPIFATNLSLFFATICQPVSLWLNLYPTFLRASSISPYPLCPLTFPNLNGNSIRHWLVVWFSLVWCAWDKKNWGESTTTTTTTTVKAARKRGLPFAEKPSTDLNLALILHVCTYVCTPHSLSPTLCMHMYACMKSLNKR